jgi:hypothetical protein
MSAFSPLGGAGVDRMIDHRSLERSRRMTKVVYE